MLAPDTRISRVLDMFSGAQQGACQPPTQTGVISFIQEVFFDNGPANFAAGIHPSGVIAIFQSSTD